LEVTATGILKRIRKERAGEKKKKNTTPFRTKGKKEGSIPAKKSTRRIGSNAKTAERKKSLSTAPP